MSKFIFKVEHVPSLNECEVSRRELVVKLEVLGLKSLYLWDYCYYHVSHEDWGKVFEDVLLNMPEYTRDKFDCENYAMLTVARVSEKYKLNSCGIAIGQSPFGYHGFNIFLSDAGLFYLEPQTGDIYSVDEDSGYKAEIIILG